MGVWRLPSSRVAVAWREATVAFTPEWANPIWDLAELGPRTELAQITERLEAALPVALPEWRRNLSLDGVRDLAPSRAPRWPWRAISFSMLMVAAMAALAVGGGGP